MKFKIIIIYFFLITNSIAENTYIYFNNLDIFYFNNKNINTDNVFYKLNNQSELLNKKFYIKNSLKKKEYFKVKKPKIFRFKMKKFII